MIKLITVFSFSNFPKLVAEFLLMDRKVDIAFVRGGIVELAHGNMALKKNCGAVLFKRSTYSVDASMRIFGLLRPVHKEAGQVLNRTLRSGEHSKDVAQRANIWLRLQRADRLKR